MKKLLLLIALPFMFLTLSAQITQEQADKIAIERLSSEMKFFTIYAQENVQTKFEITTSTGEILELSYPCWIYYVNFTDEPNGKYLIVKESNGNVLETNVKNDNEPNDLEDWRFVNQNNWYKYSLSKTLCQWSPLIYDFPVLIIINSNEELKKNINCAEGNYPQVDFSKYSLLLINLKRDWNVTNITENFLKLSDNDYILNIEFTFLQDIVRPSEWLRFAIVTEKMSPESNVEFNITEKGNTCQAKNLDYDNDYLIVINSSEELENYVECTDDKDFPKIDFSKHTLLLAVGTHDYGIRFINTQLTKKGENEYNFVVQIIIMFTAVETPWTAKTLIAKLPPDAVVSLRVFKL